MSAERPLFAYLDNNNLPIAFAHQGGDLAGWYKRNTMPAFDAAYDEGYRYFETDVICSIDGKVVAFHGSSGKREEAQSGLPLRSMLQGLTYDEIRSTHTIDGEEMPLLDDVLDAWPDVRVNIDPKTKEVVRPLAQLLRQRNAIDRVCVTAFKYARAKGVAEELGGQDKICTGLGPLGAVALKSHGLLMPGYLSHTEAACLQLPHQHVTAGMVDVAHNNHLSVHVWTPNETSEMERSLRQGVDGVMTDKIVELRQVLSQRGEWREAA